jgi:acetyl-CoA carboxylase biotin carboxyl carrier protein
LLTFEQIKELIELVCSHRLEGLEIESSGFRVKIAGDSSARAAAHAPVALELVPAAGGAVVAAPPAAVGGASTGSATGALAPTPSAAAAAAGLHVLSSPIVGTFYRSPSPDTPPFAEVGSRVKKGQVLCIIEAMKLMNEIESDSDGVIAQIYPQNSQPVEFGEPLFAIQP